MVEMISTILDSGMFHVAEELRKSMKRYGGVVTTDPVRASALLINEASEVLAEALKMTNPSGQASHRGAKGTKEAMIKELAQVGNLAIQMIYNLEKES